MSFGDFGRSAIMHVGHSYGTKKANQRGEYILRNDLSRVVIDGEIHELRASRTKPNTNYVRQHLFINLELGVFKVVEVSNWKGYDNEW